MDKHLRILHTVAETVSRSLDVDEVLRTAVEALTHVTGHEIASLHLIAADGARLQLRGERGMSERLRQVNETLPVGQGLIGKVAATGRSVRLDNVAAEPDLFSPARNAVRSDAIRGFVCVPIRARERILGTLSLGRRTPDRFTDVDVALLEATADQIGIALDNARLYSEVQRQLDELRRTQAQLIRAEKLSAVGELASGVAHEINNPLTTILGQAHLLLADRQLPAAARERLTIIAEETSRAARIVQNLLTFARHYTPERRACSLPDQFRRVLQLKAYQLQQDGIRVETEFSPCPPVYADENQIQQVLLNLVQNAHQAMARHDGPRALTIRVAPVDGAARIEVLDTGPGIPPEHLPKIFDPFFTTKPPGEGSGLGLSVSYGIISEHAGRLWGENRPGGGAAFIIELPLGKR
ncbi:MAG: GAF domain-containing protein [Candidatus Rokubacteria bacterium]|nr:GAF domain-containing protein [Candidatus Rokubacteria bacterium]